MAERKSWAVGAVAGVGQVNELDARLAIGGLIAPAGAITSRGGLLPAAAPGAVTATSPTPNGLVHVAPFRAVLQSARPGGGGVYIMCLDSIKDIDVLGPAPAHPANPRVDLIVYQQSDTYHADANSNMVVRHVVGTPSGTPIDPDPTAGGLSPDYLVRARILVPANATAITTSDITNVDVPWTVAAGGLLPIRNITERATIANPYAGMAIYRLDRAWSEVYDGAAWRVVGVAHGTSVADLAVVTSPRVGQLAVVTVGGVLYRWSGSAWVPQLSASEFPPAGQTGSGTIASGQQLIVSTVTIPNPGYPYYIHADGSIGWSVVAANIGGRLFEGAITVDSEVYNVNRLIAGYQPSDSIGANFTQTTLTVPPVRSDRVFPAAFVGSKVVRLIARNTSSPAADFTVPAAAADTTFNVRIVPA